MYRYSIIIPTFNSAANISVVLDSIASQTEKNVEVVIMDGVSSDNTLEIAEGFKDEIPGLKIFQEKSVLHITLQDLKIHIHKEIH